MIQTIENQVAVARQVLAAAESQAAMSEKELSVVRERITAARSEIEAAGSEEHKAREELREVESGILSDQGPESPLGKAQAAIDEAQQTLDRELHRVVSLPEHAVKLTAADRSADARLLSASDRETLRNDSQYQSALGRLEGAKRNYAQLREDLLKRNPEWVAASKAVAEAHRKESKLKQDSNSGVLPAMPAKRSLRTSQEVAAAARATIAQGEAMLRQLGVKNVGGASKPKK
jgi:chromosome segregation ATPase